MFRSRGVDEELLKTWVAEDIAVRQPHGELQPAMADVRLLRNHVAAAVHHSNNSCPGPDGIPYAAWRRLGDDAIDVLWTAMREMTEEESPPSLGGIKENLQRSGSTLLETVYPEFNESLLLFLPKKAVDTTAEAIEIYEPGGRDRSMSRILTTA